MTTQGEMTIYNKRIGADRRDLYYPTRINAVSYAETLSSEHAKKSIEDAPKYKIRIPIDSVAENGKTYINEASFRAADEEEALKHWTISHSDLITLGPPLLTSPAAEREIREAAAEAGVNVIIVAEYADNTRRGTPRVQHWRIGGR